MKILIVTSSLDDGGVARIVSDLTLLLPKDWDFDIVLTHSDDIRYDYKGRIISLEMEEPVSRTNIYYAIKVFVKRVLLLRKLKLSREYDVCISFMDSGNVANIVSGNKYCKTIVSVENYMSLQGKYDVKYRLIVNPMIKLLYNKANMIVVCSDESKDDLNSNFGIKNELMKRIYCSVDNKEISDKIESFVLPKEEKWFDNCNTIVSAGRLSKQKGHWHLIRAFSRVVENAPDTKLVIFGEGDLKGYYESLISSYDLSVSIKLHSYTKDLPGFISKSSGFVMPSLFEGFPTAMLMALSCGVPCVASDFVSGAREQLAPGYKGYIDGYYEGEYGILTEKLDDLMLDKNTPLTKAELGLADALINLLTDKTLSDKYKKLAKERSESFDSKNVCREWEEIVRQVCQS